MSSDNVYMDEAIMMAEEAMKAKEVPIGCVIVDKATADIIGRGRNRTNETCNATRHAEFEAICQVAVKFAPHSPPRWDQMTLYVTVEPCIMCAAALRKIGLVDVRFGCYNERFGGCGSIINAHSDYVEIDPSLEIVLLENYRKPCIELLRRFYLQQNERAPMPKKKGSRTFKEYIENSME